MASPDARTVHAIRSPNGIWLSVVACALLTAWEVTTPRLAVRFETIGTATTPMWMGRLAMALASAIGIGAVFVAFARLVDKRAGAYAAAILATTPVWFVHGRTSTGAIVPMAAEAVVLSALGVALLADTSARTRVVAALVAAAAAGLGAKERGLFVVVAPSAIAIGLVALSRCVAVSARRDGAHAGAVSARRDGANAVDEPTARASETTVRATLAALSLVVGAGLSAVALFACTTGADGALLALVVGPKTASATKATFEAPIAAIAYALLPWTSLVPIAFARLQRIDDVHCAVTLTAVLAIAAHSLLAPRSGIVALVGIAPIACAIALALHSLDDLPAKPGVARLRRIARPSALVVAMVVVTGALVAHDVQLAPERLLTSLDAHALGPASLGAIADSKSELAAAAHTLQSATYLAVGLAAFALLFPRSWLPTTRGLAVLAAGAFAGLVLRAYAYPGLLMRLSPSEAVEAYLRHRAPDERLATLGVDVRSVGPQAGPVTDLANAGAGAQWLSASPRAFLALSDRELAPLNAAFRAIRGVNVPILAGARGSVLLATTALGPGDTSENALDRVVLDAPPRGLHPLGAKLGDGDADRLEAIGWDLVDEGSHPLGYARAGTKSHLRVAIRVLGDSRDKGAYCTFIHVDHTPARFSAEHREHVYPMALWREGDIILDDFEVALPPQFVKGRYAIAWGVGVLPCHDDRRMRIRSGPEDGHGRVPGGTLEVR